MKTISRLFREVQFEILKVAFLTSFLNSCMIFFALYILVILIDISYVFALLFGFLFFIANFLYWKNKLSLKTVEDANPQVKEMLRTAFDYKEEKNVLVLGLFYDLVKKMKKVSSGNMLDSNLLFKKVVAITILAFAVVFISSLEVYMGNIYIPIDGISADVGNFFAGGDPGKTKNTTLETLGFNKSTGLYGDDSLAKLGKEELNLNINPSISEIDFDREKDLEDKAFDKSTFPVELSVQGSDFSGNDIPEEAELAKAYNLKLKR